MSTNLHEELPNLLPADGIVQYFGQLLPPNTADVYFHALMEEIAWAHDEVIMFGKKITTKRKTAWYGDAQLAYTYSNVTKAALPWTASLLDIKTLVEKASGETYNSCLLNLYHNGEEAMGWHSDNERDLKKHGAISSVSLGAKRKFVFKHRQTNEQVALHLAHGSLLVMEGATQDHWLHRLAPSKKVREPRINLTFRTIDR